MNIKKFIAFILVFGIVSTSCLYSASASTGTSEQSKLAGEVVGSIMELILENYYFDVTLEELYEGAIIGMTFMLDEYSAYFTQNELMDFLNDMSGNMVGIGIVMEQKGAEVFVSDFSDPSPAKDAGIKIGDKITKINDTQVTGMNIDKIHETISTGGNTVKLTVTRNSQEVSFTIIKTTIRYSTVGNEIFDKIYEGGSSKVGYISIDAIEENTAEDFKATMQYMKQKNVERIVLDLRNNPGGDFFQAIDICKMVVPEGPIAYTVDKQGNKEEFKSELKTLPFNKIAVLVNNNTASAAEIIASALQDSGSLVVGETTYGKGLIQTLYQLYLNDAMKITIKEYLRRNGNKVDRIGVIPDVVVSLPKYLVSLDNVNYTNLKEILRYIGYVPGQGDSYDTVTVEQVKLFQTSIGVEPNGVINETTALELNRALYYSILKNDVALRSSYDLIIK